MNTHLRRWTTGVLLATIVLATVAPAAQAGRRARYKHSTRYERVTRTHAPGSVYIVRRSSGAGPAIAGFLGGLFLGATLARTAPAGYSYYDPYCEERFVSLEVYRGHLHRHHHPRIVRVIAVDSGEYVRSYRYHHGEWSDCEDDEDWED